MRSGTRLLLATVLPAMSGTALAQPADLPIPAATTSEFPAGIKVVDRPDGPIYVDAQGRTLYGMDMRILRRFSPDPSQYCSEQCLGDWAPVAAPDGKQANIAYPTGFGSRGRADHAEKMKELDFHPDPAKAPDWTVIEGTRGPQLVYKGWHMVFTRRDEAPGEAAFDGAESFTWNTLKYVPPAPAIEAPPLVSTVFAGGAYAFADDGGRILFTGTCNDGCQEWTPLAGGLASRGKGDWRVDRSGNRPQWTWRGQPVFVGTGDDPAVLPDGARILRPAG